jgi:hypothetical protein
MMRRTWMAAGVATVSVVLLGGCSSDSGDATTTTEKVTTTSGAPKDLSVSTPEGEVSLSLDGKLPSDWPKDFPTPDRTDVAGSGALAGKDSGVMVGVYTTKESGQDAFDFYAKDDSLQPSNPKSAGIGSGFLGSVDIGGDYDGSVTVAGISDTIYIVVVLNTDGAGSTTTTAASGGSSTTTSTTSTTTTTAG